MTKALSFRANCGFEAALMALLLPERDFKLRQGDPFLDSFDLRNGLVNPSSTHMALIMDRHLQYDYLTCFMVGKTAQKRPVVRMSTDVDSMSPSVESRS